MKNKLKFKKLVIEGLAWLFCLLVLFWLFIGAYYSYPNAEDLSLANISRDEGILNAATRVLCTFDGRYTTNLLHGLNFLAFDWYYGYKWMPPIAISLFTWSCFFFIKSIFIKSISNYYAILSSLIFVCIFFTVAPTLQHSLYWMIASFVYLYPWIFLFFLGGFILKYMESEKNIWFFLSLLFLFLATGLNEMFLVFNGVLISFLLVISFKKKKFFLESSLLFIIGILSILLFITSPGIIYRINAQNNESLIFTQLMFKASGFFLNATLNWLFKNVFIVFGGFLIFYFLPERKIFLTKKQVLLILIVAISTAFLMTFTFYLPMGYNFYPRRVFSSLLPFFLLSLVFIFIFIFKKKQVINSYFVVCISSFLLLGIFNSKNNINTIKEEYSNGILTRFKSKMDKQYYLLKNVKRGEFIWSKVELKKLDSLPSVTAYGPNIEPNRKDYFWNEAYQIYFHVDEVCLEGDTVKVNVR